MRKKRKLRARAAAEAARQANPDIESGDGEAGDEELALEEEGEAGDGLEAEEDEEGDSLEAEENDAAEDAADEDESAVDADGLEDQDADGDSVRAESDDSGDFDGRDDEGSIQTESDELDESSGPDAAGDVSADPDAELTPAFTVGPERLKSILESLLFASEKPLTPVDLKRLSGVSDGPAIQSALDILVEEYKERGVALYDVAGGYQFRTHPSNSEYVQRLIAGRPVRLSRAQLETLAIIAYRQPVTRPEIDEIRGVDSGSTLKVLLDRTLIRVLGKKEEPGRPLLYGTSKEFLEFFNLSELRDLPTLREFHELTDESLREVEALDQAGQEEGEQGAVNGAGGDEDGDPGDESSAATTH